MEFVLSQELSRHIRDKVCKTDASQTQVVKSERVHLTGISLKESPIEIDSNQLDIASSSTNEATAIDIELRNENSLCDNSSNKINDNIPTEFIISATDAIVENIDTNIEKTLWGCKQCDFR